MRQTDTQPHETDGTDTNPSQFAVGFTSAAFLVTAIALAAQAWAWTVRQSDDATAYFEWLQEPVFSILDLFAIASVLLAVAVVIVTLQILPRS